LRCANLWQVNKYVDIPLQHISDPVLKAMNRPPMLHTKTLLNKLRDRIPGLVLRTTFITGFPGETEEDHRVLVDFVKEMKFERAGCFAYSEEEGTPAAIMSQQVALRPQPKALNLHVPHPHPHNRNPEACNMLPKLGPSARRSAPEPQTRQKNTVREATKKADSKGLTQAGGGAGAGGGQGAAA
jgi:hypothetical protein